MNPRFKTTPKALAAAIERLQLEVDRIKWNNVQGAWLTQTLQVLVIRLAAQAKTAVASRKSKVRFSLSVNESFAIVLVTDAMDLNPILLADNQLLILNQSIKQFYA